MKDSISLVSFLFLFISSFSDVFAFTNRQLCHPEQRDALLEFKNEFEIRSPCDYGLSPLKTESWTNNSDCCYWDGLKCESKTGNVVEIDLSHNCLNGQLNSKTTLFRLQNFRFLTILDLSYNNLTGQIPYSLENLTNLKTLDFSANDFSGEIPSLLGNILHLTSLDLSFNNFAGEIPYSLGNLLNLTFLHIFENKFVGGIPSSFGNLSHLTDLDLSYNNFVGEIPSSFGSLNQLASLSASNNKLCCDFPLTLLNLTKLSTLSLSSNQFTGKLPPNMSSLSNLEYFSADYNSFTGTLPSSLFTIPSLNTIRLGNNKFNGTLDFGNISSKIVDLSLGNNNLRGSIPISISKLVNLVLLDLSNLNTQGSVDFSIFSHLKSLRYLLLSHLNTTISLNGILSYFKSLDLLDLSGNHVTTTTKNSVSNPPLAFVSVLYLSGCDIAEFPKLLRIQHKMTKLDISNNKITGQVPSWLWMFPVLRFLNLSNNAFIGFEKPTKPGPSFVRKSSMSYLYGANNNFTAKIPSFICEFLSLTTLDLSGNRFNGSIPRCMGTFSSTLEDLNLRHNHLSGGLPENISKSLISLDVGHNQLVGKLPRSLVNNSFLEVLNVESNILNDTFPFWLSSLQELQVLVIRSNAFHGPVQQIGFLKLRIIDISLNHFDGTLPPDCFVNWTAMFTLGKNETRYYQEYMGTRYYVESVVLMNKGIEMELKRIIKIYTSIDFSGNKFEGEIPSSIGLLKELHVLNLSNNAFTGHIPSSMANLIELESLDVSQNKLSGEIPQDLGDLSYLSYMNFSHNQLQGKVPGGTQFQTQPCSSFGYNKGLYGPSLDKACVDIHATTLQQSEKQEREEDEEVISWIAAAIGFIPGIAIGLTFGYILVCYKPQSFMNPFSRNKRKSIHRTTH